MPSKTDPLNVLQNSSLRRPEWLKVRFGSGESFRYVKNQVSGNRLHTVCESARCPNLGECWSRGTATFMVLGNTCTRSCKFCNIDVGKPDGYDPDEPQRVAEAVLNMGVKHAVITMVARDDLKDGGAYVVAETIRMIKENVSDCSVEALISDLKGNKPDLEAVLSAQPDILNHNLETVRRLQKDLRVQGRYDRSLNILRWSREACFTTKSGIMVGVGETYDEIIELMQDLREIDCSSLTIGQYLPPTNAHYPLHRYYTPDEFDDLRELGIEMGFTHVESGPLVRSSYHAEKAITLSAR